MAQMRFENKTKRIQVVYNEAGIKRELPPGGTIILEENWGKRFSCLKVKNEPKKATSSSSAEK